MSAGESGGGSSGSRNLPPAPPPGPADVGIVAALPIEVAPLLDRFQGVRRYAGPRHKFVEGECAGKVVALVVAGTGRKAARRAAQLLIDGHRPTWVISAGFAGALDPALARNSILFATEVVAEDGPRWAIDVTIPPEAESQRIRAGRLLTVDRIVRSANEKAALRAKYQADAVDMESSAVAAVCGERQVRFLSIRVVSDEAGTDLPAEVLSILGRTGSYRVGAAIGALWRRPSSFKDLWVLREHAVEAADRLAEVVAGALHRLV
jgi:adenosylhomocysteine nucleosidase